MKPRSIDLKPGDVIQHVVTWSRGTRPPRAVQIHKSTAVIDRRKRPTELGEAGWPGWWLRDGGGLADRAFDDPEGGWSLVTSEAQP